MAEPNENVSERPTDEQIDVHGLTHPGLVRSRNEDNFLVCSLHKTIRVHATSLPRGERIDEYPERLGILAVVADGLGGLDRGEEASRMAIETVTGYATQCMECFHHADPRDEMAFMQRLQQAVVRCHEEVLARVASEEGRSRMATTLTLLLTHWPRVYLVQVGDSRCYLLRDGELLRMTRDQTLAQSLVDEGALSEAQAAGSRFAHILSSAIGGERVDPVTTSFTFEPRDVILLCTDGLTRHVEDAEIRDHLARLETAEETAQALRDLALERGGSDNVTILIGCLKRPVA